jgi:hypothetical protein
MIFVRGVAGPLDLMGIYRLALGYRAWKDVGSQVLLEKGARTDVKDDLFFT